MDNFESSISPFSDQFRWHGLPVDFICEPKMLSRLSDMIILRETSYDFVTPRSWRSVIDIGQQEQWDGLDTLDAPRSLLQMQPTLVYTQHEISQYVKNALTISLSPPAIIAPSLLRWTRRMPSFYRFLKRVSLDLISPRYSIKLEADLLAAVIKIFQWKFEDTAKPVNKTFDATPVTMRLFTRIVGWTVASYVPLRI